MDYTTINVKYEIPSKIFTCRISDCNDENHHYHCSIPECLDVVYLKCLHLHCSHPDCDFIFIGTYQMRNHNHCCYDGCEILEEHDHYDCCDRTDEHVHCNRCEIDDEHYHCENHECVINQSHIHCDVICENNEICDVTKIHNHCNKNDCNNRVVYEVHEVSHCNNCGLYESHYCCENCDFKINSKDEKLSPVEIYEIHHIHKNETDHNIVIHCPRDTYQKHGRY